jgi:hypothetical protein
MTADLVEWLTRVWDEQEKREAGRYRPREGMELAEVMTADDGLMFIRWEHGGRPEFIPRERYISEFLEPDPDSFALARIAADRQILALHAPHLHEGIGMLCRCCAGGAGANADWPCETVRLLAEPYADREGFRDEWRVTEFERWLADE